MFCVCVCEINTCTYSLYAVHIFRCLLKLLYMVYGEPIFFLLYFYYAHCQIFGVVAYVGMTDIFAHEYQ